MIKKYHRFLLWIAPVLVTPFHLYSTTISFSLVSNAAITGALQKRVWWFSYFKFHKKTNNCKLIIDKVFVGAISFFKLAIGRFADAFGNATKKQKNREIGATVLPDNSYHVATLLCYITYISKTLVISSFTIFSIFYLWALSQKPTSGKFSL